AFINQDEVKYSNGPFIDAFVNMQWKRACIFVKLENAGMGWPMDKADYFSANNYIRTQRCIKFGVYWPFYRQPSSNKAVHTSGGGGATGGVRSAPKDRGVGGLGR
ncbi:MAG: putative porin, partial [Candidatus Cryptobacteroides sp.]